ncbi:MAG: pitrilysin family protein [Pseudomonadota bacterium]
MMYNKSVLKNGVRILSEKLPHYRSVSLGIWVNVGSREEIERENGISHFIEHMIFKGTRNRSNLEIARQLDAIGGLSNAFTGKEYTCFHARVLDRHFSTLAEILSDIFLHSIFDPVEMDRERQVILQEISMVEDTPDEQIHELFNEVYWAGHPLGMSILGNSDTVSSIQKDQIHDYMARFYTPDRIIIACAGNIDHHDLTAYFSPLFETIADPEIAGPGSSPSSTAGVSCHFKNLEQVHICLGGKAPHLSSESRFASALFNTILGGNMSSRLFQEIREKHGLAYSVYSFLSSYSDTGLLGIYVGTGASEVNRVLEMINIEVTKLQKGEISRSDLAEAKENIIGGILLGSESADNMMMRLSKNEFVFGRYISFDDLIAAVEKVTLDEVIASAIETFTDHGVTLTTLGPLKSEDLDLSCLQFNGS